MKKSNTCVMFLYNRIFWGFLAGLASWLVLAFFLQMPLGYSPVIGVIISMLISRLYEPKRLAGLSACIGVLAGIVFGMQIIFQEFSPTDIVTIVLAPFLVGLISILSSLLFAFYGLLVGTIAKLYKQGAIF